jgi:subtilisin family serine protease
VRVPEGSTAATVEALAREAGCVVVNQLTYLPHYYRFRVNGQAGNMANQTASAAPVTDEMMSAVIRLNSHNGVRAFPDYVVPLRRQNPIVTPVVPNDPLYPGGNATQSRQQWHLDMVRMPEAWALQTGVRQAVVAVVDSGLDAQHPDFTRPDGVDIVLRSAARNFGVNGVDNNYDDPDGHGTHVAGTVAAATNNAIGVAGVAGWNRNGVDVRILPLRVTFGDTSFTSAVFDALEYARLQKVDVVNLSLGYKPRLLGLPPAAAENLINEWTVVVNRLLADNIVVVVANGNDAANHDLPQNFDLPSDIPGTISVSAVGPTRRLASYSDFGGTVAMLRRVAMDRKDRMRLFFRRGHLIGRAPRRPMFPLAITPSMELRWPRPTSPERPP